MKKFYLFFLISAFWGPSFSAEIELIKDQNLIKKYKENIKDVLIRLNETVSNPFLNILVVKPGDTEYRFKFQKDLSENLYLIKPLSDFIVDTVCPDKCSASVVKLNASEEFEIYFKNKPLRRNESEKVYDGLSGDVKVRYGFGGSLTIGSKSYPVLFDYGISINKVLVKNIFGNMMISFTGGLDFDFIKTDLSTLKLSYVNDNLEEASLINLSIPYSVHFMPFSFLSLYLGFNFNATHLPLENEVVDDSSGKDLNRKTSLSGSLSTGFHGGVGLIFGNYTMDFRITSFNFTISEDEEYQIVDGTSTETRYKVTKFYESSFQQMYLGVGVTF